jgi:Arc/MetJ-type ribon-helix-helix transcriptional regulator
MGRPLAGRVFSARGEANILQRMVGWAKTSGTLRKSGFDWSVAVSKKLATTIYITEQQQQLLKELNKRSKVPIAEFIREGIDLVLEKYSDRLTGQLELKMATDKSEVSGRLSLK